MVDQLYTGVFTTVIVAWILSMLWVIRVGYLKKREWTNDILIAVSAVMFLLAGVVWAFDGVLTFG